MDQKTYTATETLEQANQQEQAQEGKTFTQSQLDSILRDRLKRQEEAHALKLEEVEQQHQWAIEALEHKHKAQELLRAAGLPTSLMKYLENERPNQLEAAVKDFQDAFTAFRAAQEPPIMHGFTPGGKPTRTAGDIARDAFGLDY